MSSITQIKDTYWKWLAVVAVATALSTANAGERTFNFDEEDEDPFDDFEVTTNNDDEEVWSKYTDYAGTGNPGDFLILTEAQNSKSTTVIFPDIDDGQLIKAFTLTADIRLGNSTGDRSADGFSVNYARADDPILNGGGLPGPAENGTATGVSVSFDTWDGNPLNDGSTVGDGGRNGSGDFEGVIVQVDGVVLGGVKMPTRHGECEDTDSIQTGPRTQNDEAVREKYPKLGEWGGNPDVLCWAPLEVTLTETGLLTVKYKGSTVLDGFQTSFFPSPGQLVLAGRTGGANEIKHVDNIVLTTVLADKALLSGLETDANGFTVTFRDIGNSRIEQNSIALELNGESITPTDVSKDGDITSVKYTQSTFFAPGSSHEVRITAMTSDGDSIDQTVPFTISGYALVGAEHKLEGTFTQRGFKMRVVQSGSNRINSLPDREDHLANPGENLADFTNYTLEDGYVIIEDVINFDQDEGTQGVFRDSGDGSATDKPDELIPGIPGTTGSTDQITAEILTVVEIPEAGLYRFAFNSDDGFKTTAGNTGDAFNAILLGGFPDGGVGGRAAGRGAATTFYNVAFEEAGFYKLRSIWYEGGGGANLEWWTADKDNDTPIALLNDDANGGLKTYRDVPDDPASVVSVSPAVDVTDAAPHRIQAIIRNGSTSLDDGSVMLTVDGEAVTPEITTSGDNTTVTFSPQPFFKPLSEHTVELSFTHGGGTAASESWSFVVETYETMDCTTGVAMEAGATRGFNFVTHQNQNNGFGGNNVNNAERRLFDDSVENEAVPPTGTIDGVVNFQQHANDTQGRFNAGNGFPDALIPGTPEPADWNNIVQEITAYIEFPEAGYYRMGVNRDDGFKVSNALSGQGPVDDPATTDVNEALSDSLGHHDAGGGTNETAFGFEVPVAGLHPMRLIWFEGGGGADVEWYSIADDGTRTLINAEGGLKAYRSLGANPTPLSCPGVGPVISASLNADGNVVLTFTGTLHSSDSVTGTFEPVAGATSPYTVTVKAGPSVPPTPGQPPTPAPQIPAAQFYIVR